MAQKLDIDSLSKKEKKEYVKNLRENQNIKEKRGKLIFTLVIILGIVLAGVGLLALTGTKDTSLPKELGVKIPVEPKTGQLHINLGESHVPYSSNPPTSGPHYNIDGLGPIECKFYDKEVLDESAVHNIEHGAVWISYKVNDSKLKEQLKTTVDGNSKVVVSYRPKNDSLIALSSWSRLLKLDSFDQTKIKQFIKLYLNGPDAPEPLAGCGTHNKT